MNFWLKAASKPKIQSRSYHNLLRTPKRWFSSNQQDWALDFSEEQERDYLEKDPILENHKSLVEIINSREGINLPQNYKEDLLSKRLPLK